MEEKELSDDYKFEVYHGSSDTILGYYNDFNVEANSVIVVNTGGIGGVKFLSYKFWCSDGCFNISGNEILSAKFIYYFLDTKTDYFISNKRVGGVPTIDKKIIENLQIPIPPLEKQREIVEILDKFSELTTDLQSGLPAEISARHKQYEYYRDKLLKF
ncbi:restriction endonuclease subunit S [Campylobacter sp. faydin G-140]|uniref:restriction endonuclease subunit S n=1 Tax=Campylobacter anatolicus TaxID=2829105 RepID=UPI001B9F4828|nr:restriction endonuclease subunit S [Campylobacter anatolicus]